MQQTKRKFNSNSPEARAYRREVRESTFVKQGMMIAFPTCFPGMTIPIPLDESRITALASTPEGAVYGGTSGGATHLFAAEFHGLTGIVFDLGVAPSANHCAAVCCGDKTYIAFVNGPKGGRAILSRRSRLSEDLIQEWGFERPPLEDLGECVAGEPVIHAVALPAGNRVIGTTSAHIFTLDLESRKFETVAQAIAGGRLAVTSGETVVGRGGPGHLWRFDAKSATFDSRAVAFPKGEWSAPLVWAKDPQTGLLYTADAAGQIFSFSDAAGFSGPLARAPLAPVGPIAVTVDGRMFGFCGAEMAKMFSFDPKTHELVNLGVAASVIERRRYGYVFADAVIGRDGEIIFGEDDNGGHLWLYFPRLLPRA